MSSLAEHNHATNDIIAVVDSDWPLQNGVIVHVTGKLDWEVENSYTRSVHALWVLAEEDLKLPVVGFLL